MTNDSEKSSQIGKIAQLNINPGSVTQVVNLQETPKNIKSAFEFPSLTKITVPDVCSYDADRFYDGFPPEFEDLMADFDFPRSVYAGHGGIRARIKEIIENDSPYIKYILIKGIGGSGKSTLLKRIALDQVLNGKIVFVLNSDWLEDKQVSNLQTQLKYLSDNYDECMIILDDISDCILHEVINFAGLNEYFKTKKILFLLADQPDRWNRILPKVRELKIGSELFVYDLHQLDPKECEDLAEKMIELETESRLTIRHRNRTKEERVKLCIESSKRHFVVAMLQIRYGEKFRNIIIKEFEKIPSEKGKEAYLMVCFCNYLDLSIPESLVVTSLHLTSSLSFNELHSFTEGIILYGKFGLSARHPIIAREIFRNFITTKFQVHFLLKQIFSSFTDSRKQTIDFLEHLLSKENFHKTFVRILEKDVELVEDLLFFLERTKDILDKDLLLKFMSFYAMTEKILGNSEKALEIFKQIIIEIDNENAFAYRQIAWIEHDNRNYDEAAKYARLSFNYSSENPEHILQAAKILALNTVENFKKAKQYYLTACQRSNNELRYQKELEKYKDAEKVFSYLSDGLYEDEFIPDLVIKELRPGLRFFRTYFDTNSKEFKHKLLNVLHAMESDTQGSMENLDEVVEGYNIKQDKLISSKYYSNLARIMYLQWYNNETILDPEEMLAIFQQSLNLNPNDPFTHCWLGTFYKEVVKDFSASELEYKKAIELSKNSKYLYDKDHPMFSNNLALLIMDMVIVEKIPHQNLFEAKALLEFSIKINNERLLSNENHRSFYWAEHSLSKCLELMDRYELVIEH